jgi:hypothetical protein
MVSCLPRLSEKIRPPHLRREGEAMSDKVMREGKLLGHISNLRTHCDLMENIIEQGKPSSDDKLKSKVLFWKQWAIDLLKDGGMMRIKDVKLIDEIAVVEVEE